MWSFFIKTHQKIDTVAYKHLSELLYPQPHLILSDILHFEGNNGPDATRLKKGASEPPWHFYNPSGNNKEFLDTLRHHYQGLVRELKAGDPTRSAFEASWLAHALVDGLTPAHHFPYESELRTLYRQEKSDRETVGSHFLVKGDNATDTVRRSFRLIGPKGLLTTHTSFEAGAGMVILPLALATARPTAADLQQLAENSSVEIFRHYVHDIEQLKMYERFYKKGWTPFLARDVRLKLAPRMVRIVTLSWYAAFVEAGLLTVPPVADKS
ncbi:MAG TPA: hypothetical protein VMR28_00395 [Candidatus Saccharimonadales bacterium]|nr:hypothetical protein [Candidatus Saccharimonadales bacterium]